MSNNVPGAGILPDGEQMRTFVSTDGCSFIFPNVESGYMGTTTVPTLDAVLEFAAFINEERAAIERGPQVVGSDLPKLLLNGGFLSIISDETLPMEAIHFLNEMGRRMVLREGRAERSPALHVAPRGTVQAGAMLIAESSESHLQHVAQQLEGGNGTADQEL